MSEYYKEILTILSNNLDEIKNFSNATKDFYLKISNEQNQFITSNEHFISQMNSELDQVSSKFNETTKTLINSFDKLINEVMISFESKVKSLDSEFTKKIHELDENINKISNQLNRYQIPHSKINEKGDSSLDDIEETIDEDQLKILKSINAKTFMSIVLGLNDKKPEDKILPSSIPFLERKKIISQVKKTIESEKLDSSLRYYLKNTKSNEIRQKIKDFIELKNQK
jgi:hypothetical protein